jgi:tRNA(adenine34) deaminase
LTASRDNEMMHKAIHLAKAGLTPFGCVIALEDEIVAEACNTVKKDNDPTAHAEINAIRKLGNSRASKNGNLTLYTTGEPCPMCMSAILYAGIHRVVYGLSISDISRFMKQIRISSQEIVNRGFKQIEIKGGILHEDCLHLFKTFNHDKR